MKVKKTRFKEILELCELAEKSGQYPKTSFLRWYSHIKFLFDRRQVVRFRIDGRVYGFLEFIRCNKEDMNKDELPDRPNRNGIVLYIPLAVTKIPGALRMMYRKALLMNPQCHYIAWHRMVNKKKDKLMITRTRNQFNFLKLKEAK